MFLALSTQVPCTAISNQETFSESRESQKQNSMPTFIENGAKSGHMQFRTLEEPPRLSTFAYTFSEMLELEGTSESPVPPFTGHISSHAHFSQSSR